jgi:HEAT repeat protein
MSAFPILLGLVLAAPADGEESALEAAGLPATDKALLDFFRKRAQPPPARAAIEQLARALGSANTAEADDAQRELLSIGAPVVPVLREAANRVDAARASRRAKQILQRTEGTQADRLPVEAARLLATRKAPGAAEALLAYLPFADNDTVVDEIVAALTAVGFRDGKVAPALLEALKGRTAFGRAAAARALCKAGGNASWKAVRPLLTDPEPAVRLQVALALADAHDSQAIAVLIECLADGPASLGAQAEEYLTRLAAEWAVHGPRGGDLVSRELRRELWATWWKKTSGELLLRELQSRTLTDEELDRAHALLRKLESEKVEARGTAAQDLVALGPRVSPLLRRAVQQGHPRVGPAAARCLDSIEREFPPIPLPEALFRMLALRRPAGTAAALLAFLPCAEDEEMVDRIERVLGSVGVEDGKAEEALVKALEDRHGIRRAVAAVALWRGHADVLPAVRKVLADKDVEVRRRVAGELASAGDKGAVATLVALLETLPEERAWEIEEQLERLAGDKAPAVITESPVNWKSVAGAWKQWWQGNQDKVVMTGSFAPASSGPLRGFTLLVQPQANSVVELGPDGKQRWALTGLDAPLDAVVLANHHVLVAEQNRVTERDLRGKVVWQKDVPRPLSVQRLPNGNTFMACSNALLLEVDRAGKDVLRASVRAQFDHLAARRLPDGRIVAFDRRNIIQMDKAGREAKRVSVFTGGAGCNEVLDNGHVLSLSPMAGSIEEFDLDGKEVASFALPGARHGFRLPNGHTLVMTTVGNKVVELDKNWKQVKETTLAAPAFRVKRR